MVEFLIDLIVICAIGYFVWRKVSNRTAREEKTERTSRNIDTLAARIYDEITKFSEDKGKSLEDIVELDVSEFSTGVSWAGPRDRYQRIDYKSLGYSIDEEEPFGRKTCMLQEALVRHLGSKWIVVSEKKSVTYTRDNEVVVSGKSDGSVDIYHPQGHFDRIESKIITRADYEKSQRTGGQAITKI